MLNKIKMLVTMIVLSFILIGTNAHAESIRVKKGDTLWELSRDHHISVRELKEWNELQTDLIHPGDALTVSPEATYTVQRGDTLWAIAISYHIHVSQLMERNSLTSDLIHPGLNLIIPNDSTTSNHVESNLEDLSTSQVKVEAATLHNERKTKVEAASTSVPSSGTDMMVTATAYTPFCAGCSGITATGMNVAAHPNAKVIAVDPSVIPLGSKVYIEGFGTYTAADTGGAIKGNRIDVLMATERAALHFGRKHLKITILE